MNLSECPFCYAQVHWRDNGSCPACGKDPKLAPADNLRYTAVQLYADQALPPCCVRCGSSTDQLEYFEFRYDSHLGDRLDEQSYMVFLLLVIVTAGAGFLLLPWYRRRLRKSREMTYHIHLPFCDACLPEKSSFVPKTIEGNAFHFKVHKSFKAQLAAEPTPSLQFSRQA
jgi:hypothetical protein